MLLFALALHALALPSLHVSTLQPVEPDSLFKFRRVEERRDIRTYFRRGNQIVGPIAVHGMAYIYEMEPYIGQTGTVTVTGPQRLVGGLPTYAAGISTDTRTPGGDVTGGQEPDLDSSVLQPASLSLFGTSSLRAALNTSHFEANPYFSYRREVAFVLPVAISANGGDFAGTAQFDVKANWHFYYNSQGHPVLVNGTHTMRAHKASAAYDASIDTRRAYGQPDREGQLPGDPNAEPSNVKFGDWIYKGGLFVGRMSPLTRDQSGTSRIQLVFPSFTPPTTDGFSRYMTLLSLFEIGAPASAPERHWAMSLFLPNATDPNLAVAENNLTWEKRWDIATREQGYQLPAFEQHYYGNQNLPYTNYRYNFSRDPILTMRVTPEVARSGEFLAWPISLSTDPTEEWPYPDPWPTPYPSNYYSLPGYEYWDGGPTWNLDTRYDDYYWYFLSTYFYNQWHREPGYREPGLTHFCIAMSDEGQSSGPMARWLWFASKEFQALPNAVFPHNDSAPRLWFLTARYAP